MAHCKCHQCQTLPDGSTYWTLCVLTAVSLTLSMSYWVRPGLTDLRANRSLLSGLPLPADLLCGVANPGPGDLFYGSVLLGPLWLEAVLWPCGAVLLGPGDLCCCVLCFQSPGTGDILCSGRCSHTTHSESDTAAKEQPQEKQVPAKGKRSSSSDTLVTVGIMMMMKLSMMIAACPVHRCNSNDNERDERTLMITQRPCVFAGAGSVPKVPLSDQPIICIPWRLQGRSNITPSTQPCQRVQSSAPLCGFHPKPSGITRLARAIQLQPPFTANCHHTQSGSRWARADDWATKRQ